MSTLENKTLAHRILEEIFNQGKLSNFAELFAPDIVIHDPDKELRGWEQVQEGITRLRTAFPDLHYIAEDTIAEGDKAVIRFTGLRFLERQVVEYWAVSDALGIFRQLGVTLSTAHTN
jgi:predicted ester cyclase